MFHKLFLRGDDPVQPATRTEVFDDSHDRSRDPGSEDAGAVPRPALVQYPGRPVRSLRGQRAADWVKPLPGVSFGLEECTMSCTGGFPKAGAEISVSGISILRPRSSPPSRSPCWHRQAAVAGATGSARPYIAGRFLWSLSGTSHCYPAGMTAVPFPLY